ncbi:MAG: hypothetical protein M0C28_44605 [Candidatus Moduliflexus flocculans]|nr:hypothetical protein [Candidatus Moduliflexus flocculans]
MATVYRAYDPLFERGGRAQGPRARAAPGPRTARTLRTRDQDRRQARTRRHRPRVRRRL